MYFSIRRSQGGARLLAWCYWLSLSARQSIYILRPGYPAIQQHRPLGTTDAPAGSLYESSQKQKTANGIFSLGGQGATHLPAFRVAKYHSAQAKTYSPHQPWADGPVDLLVPTRWELQGANQNSTVFSNGPKASLTCTHRGISITKSESRPSGRC